MTTMSVTEHWVERWTRDGFLPVIDVLSPNEARECRRAFDGLEREVGRETAEVRILDRHLDVEFVWRLATHPRVLAPVEAVLGPDVMLLASNFFCKYPADERGERFVAWHQDVTYWGLEPPKAITAWIAIDDADVENGCMSVIPGSHRAGLVAHGKSDRAGNLLSVNQEVPDDLVDAARAVSMPLRAGQMSLHDGMLLHGSHPNRSSRRRCGLAVRFTTPDVRQASPNSVRGYYRPVLVRGIDRHGHFPPVEVPWRP
jgi:ectoine hydroxylase-related dioxygenase (phytanoyl-CoA dioxygenase family)